MTEISKQEKPHRGRRTAIVSRPDSRDAVKLFVQSALQKDGTLSNEQLSTLVKEKFGVMLNPVQISILRRSVMEAQASGRAVAKPTVNQKENSQEKKHNVGKLVTHQERKGSMREGTKQKHEFIKGILAENNTETNDQITENVKKEFGTGIALNDIAKIRKSMGIKGVKGARPGTKKAAKKSAKKKATPAKKKAGRPKKAAKKAGAKKGRGRPKKKAGRPKKAAKKAAAKKRRGRPKKVAAASTPSHILLVNGELITCASREDVEKIAAKSLAGGTLPEVYSRSEKPFEFVVKFR